MATKDLLHLNWNFEFSNVSNGWFKLTSREFNLIQGVTKMKLFTPWYLDVSEDFFEKDLTDWIFWKQLEGDPKKYLEPPSI